MRIAQIAPLHESVPPKFYGGTERVVSYLTEALVDLGEDVTLFATADSKTSANLIPCWPSALRFDSSIKDTIAPHILLLEIINNFSNKFDILHFHIDYYSFPLFKYKSTPSITTMHGRLDLPELQRVFKHFRNIPLVSISNNQKSYAPYMNWINTIYHGLPENNCDSYLSNNSSYLAFLGRISPEKGLDKAIKIAERSNMPLKIAAKLDKVDYIYYNEIIKPLIKSPNIEYIGEISELEKPKFLSNAHSLLFPINWPEPFGLVMIEAMKYGTPVIAFNCGSVSEIIDNGITGFIVSDEDDAVLAVSKISNISRKIVIETFKTKFSSKIMAKKYVLVYKNLLKGINKI